MSTVLPTDDFDHVIPALRFHENGAHHITASNVSTRNALAFQNDTVVLSLYATVPVYLAFGDETAVADNTNHFFPAGVYYDVAIGDGSDRTSYSHVAVLALEANGVVYVSEKH